MHNKVILNLVIGSLGTTSKGAIEEGGGGGCRFWQQRKQSKSPWCDYERFFSKTLYGDIYGSFYIQYSWYNDCLENPFHSHAQQLFPVVVPGHNQLMYPVVVRSCCTKLLYTVVVHTCCKKSLYTVVVHGCCTQLLYPVVLLSCCTQLLYTVVVYSFCTQ